MKIINNEQLEKLHMGKSLNDPCNQQIGVSAIQQLMQNNLDAPEDKTDIPVADANEVEVPMTFQRRPQFRFNENNKRRFS